MSKLSKRAISILVIAILTLSFASTFLSVSAALTTVTLSTYAGDKGDKIVVTGAVGDATSGATIEIYWDTAIGVNAQLLNSTTAKADGSYEVEFKVPEAVKGDHFVWAKDVSGPYYLSSDAFVVSELVKPSPSSGLPGDDIDVKGYGFIDDAKVGIIMEQTVPLTSTEVLDTGTGAKFVFAGILTNIPVLANSITITATVLGSQVTIADNGVGGLAGAASGAINYVTGVWDLTFTGTAPDDGKPITAVYTWTGSFLIQALDTFETDELGSFIKTFDVPSLLYGNYNITTNSTVYAKFKIGASISITPEEGPTGTIVTVEGKGWTPDATMSFTLEGETVVVVDKAVITVGSTGKFSADVVIPGMGSEGEYSLKAIESGLLAPASVDFEVTGIPEVVVSPTYGSPGATISVTGSNFTQVAGTEVFIELHKKVTPFEHVADLVIAETKSDGTFEDTFMSPAVMFTGYDVTAEDLIYHMYAEDAFKVGLIALIINPIYGEAGTKTSITGIGFATGDYNVTFGTKLYENHGTVQGEAISDPFYVPNVELGTYDLTVIDTDENELTVHFTVTAVTEVILDPAKAPNEYNMTIEGYNFADKASTVDFVIYNATDEWDMDVNTYIPFSDQTTMTDDDGNFTGHWHVPPADEMSLGDYTINVTGYDDFLLQVNFSIVEARVDVAPRKALFDRGDTIQFNVKNDFYFDESYIKIWDPYDNLYWRTEAFTSWLKVGDVYTVPYYLQTSGRNPMTLSQDAPLGTWFYIFYEEGTTQLTNGTFVVGPSAAAQVEEKLTEIWGSMEDLSEDVTGITDELEDDIAALSGDIDDVVADVEGMIDDITADLAGELAQVASDTEAAVGDLEDSIGDIAAAQNELASNIDASLQESEAAREAAEEAQGAAQGLTTLVYGAIGASLIAALAAIVSLMQISKKIA